MVPLVSFYSLSIVGPNHVANCSGSAAICNASIWGSSLPLFGERKGSANEALDMALITVHNLLSRSSIKSNQWLI